MNDQGGSRYLQCSTEPLSHANFMASRLGGVVFYYLTLTVYCITAADGEMLIAHHGEECELTTQSVLYSVLHLCVVKPVEMLTAKMVVVQPTKCGGFSLSLRSRHCMWG